MEDFERKFLRLLFIISLPAASFNLAIGQCLLLRISCAFLTQILDLIHNAHNSGFEITLAPQKSQPFFGLDAREIDIFSIII